MKNIIALVLVLVGLVLAYLAFQTYQEATAGFEFLGIEISARDNIAMENVFLYAGGAVLCFVFAYFSSKRR
ncbi:MAG: hypothetical protein MRY78_10725 [Saprospiraceae bacterium]|nr:hypothetical protein [Saprospiraceae bacterium]